MPTAVVILPTSTYRAADFVRAAETLDVDLVVASEQPSPLDMGDRYLQIDCTDTQTAAEAIADLGDTVAIDGVVAADDQGVLIAAHASEILGVAGNPPEAARATRDKLEMRRRLEAVEVDQPEYSPLQPGDDAVDVVSDLGLPVVIKPLDRSASQGVIRVDEAGLANQAARRIRSIVGSDTTLLVERYVPGKEIAIEGLMGNGELTVLAVFDKPDTSAGPFFPETLFVTPSRLPGDVLDIAHRRAAEAVRALGLTNGPVHVELRVDDHRARVIEIAARSIGGLCSRSLNFGLMGTTLESLILRNAMGDDIARLHREPMASGVLMIPTPKTGVLQAIAGEEETRSIEAVTGIDFTVVPGTTIVAPPEGDRYIGFVYARSEKPETVENALRKAMTILQVQVEG
ncbi:MAG: ATP-grasp domain-containing protein [Acidimicrobiia bacterium]|jgi:biotin carboxylase